MTAISEDDFTHYLTTTQVAAVFDVDQSTIARWTQRGLLESSRFGTGATSPRVYNAETVETLRTQLVQLAESDQP